jgi:hypothetical protein
MSNSMLFLTLTAILAATLVQGQQNTLLVCDAGFESLNGLNCSVCRNGTFKVESNADLCQDCPVGSTWSGAIANNCDVCDEYANFVFDYANSSSREECVCAIGHELRNFMCSPCSPGYYKDRVGNDGCDACPLQRNSRIGAVSVDECGSASLIPGFISIVVLAVAFVF